MKKWGVLVFVLLALGIVTGVQAQDTMINYGDTVTGTLQPGQDVTYIFAGNEGDVVVVDIFANDPAQVLAIELIGGDLWLGGYDTGGGLFQNPNQPGTLQSGLRLPTTGTYTIILHANAITAPAPYSLSLNLLGILNPPPVSLGDEIEGQLRYGETARWVITLDTGEGVIVEGESADFPLNLTGGGIMAPVTGLTSSADTTFQLHTASLRFVASETSNYTVALSYLPPLWAGPYDDQPGNYSLTFTRFVEVQNAPIAYGDTVSSDLGDNMHSYVFSGAAGDTVTISLDSEDFDAYVVINDATGNRVIADDDSGEGLNARIESFVLPASGDYTIIVGGYRGTVTGTYTLALSAGQPPLVPDVPPDEPPIEPPPQEPVTELPIFYGDMIEGTLENSTQTYVFTGVAGDLVTIDLESGEFDAYLELFDNNGNQLTYNDDGGVGLNSQIAFYSLPYSGEYSILVRGLGGTGETTGTYMVSLRQEEPQEPVENEPISFGVPVTGTLQANTHTYIFSARADDLVTIDLESDDFDCYLYLLDEDGNELTYNDDGGDGYNSRILFYALPYSGDYIIEVDSFSGGGSGNYTLTLRMEEPVPPVEDELLAYGDSAESTLVNNTHTYVFAGVAGDYVSISAASDTFTPIIDLLGPDGTQLTSTEDSYAYYDANITAFTLPATGEYTIVVRGFEGSAVGNYSLSLDQNVLQGALNYRDTVAGTLDGDVHLYTFSGVADEMVTIDLQSDAFDTYLELYGPDGNQLMTDDDGGDGLNSRIGFFMLPASGEYVIVARGLSDGVSGDYTLSLESIEVTPVVNEPIALGDAASNVLQGNTHTYVFNGTADEMVTIDLQSPDFDTYLELLDQDGNQLITNDDGGEGLNSRIAYYVLPYSGDYTILVRGYSEGAVGGYTLTLQRQEPIPPVIDGPIAYGESASSTLINNTHTYLFSGAAGDYVTIEAYSDYYLPVVELLDPAGNLLTSTDNTDYYYGALISVFNLPVTGEYTIVVRGYEGDTVVGEYTLSLEQNVVQGAISIDESLEGTLSGTAQLYTFSGAADEMVTIELAADDFDPYLTLYGPSGAELAYDDDSAGDLNARIQFFTLPESGEYILQVQGYGEPTGNFTLSVASVEVIRVVDEPIAYGESATNALQNNTHTYLFSGAAGDVVIISLDSDAFDCYLELLDGDANQLTYNDDGGEGYNSRIGFYVLPYSGDYTILVRGYSDTALGDYTLTLTQVTEEPPVEDGPIAYGETVTGLLFGVQHSYIFEGAADDLVSLDVSSPDFAPVVELYTLAGDLVGSTESDGYSAARIAALQLPVDGTYRVIVRGTADDSAGEYTLALRQEVLQGEIFFGDTVTGTLNDEMHFYAFSGVEGDLVTISMSSDIFDTYLELNGPSGEWLVSDDDGGEGYNSRLTAFTLPETGAYMIVARAYGGTGTGDYTLTLDYEQVQGVLSYGDTVEGALGSDEPLHLYSFSGEQGDLVSISLSSDDFDTYVELNDTSGSYLTADDDGGTDLNSLISFFPLPATGEYTILVRGYGDTLGTYTLSLSTGEIEVVENQPIAYGETADGILISNTHSYIFSGAAGDSVTISLSSAEFDTYLELLDADGNRVAADDDGGGNLDSRIEDFELPAAGEYTIVVRSFGGSASGGYTLALESTVAPPPDGDVVPPPDGDVVPPPDGDVVPPPDGDVVPPPDGDVVPPPDGDVVPDVSGTISYGETITGTLTNNIHTYTFTGQDEDIVFVSLTSFEFDAYVELTNIGGSRLASDNDDGPGPDALISAFELPSDGQYRIVVSGFDGAASGDFELVLDQVQPQGTINMGDVLDGTLDANIHIYTFSATAGDTVSVSLTSDDFDTYL
ncbi:MAG: hypothetical protein GYB65_00825, partial [Chloroflexi bacterium]|nr:hypothetical protein [Chloroflexota bacterium]